MNFTRSADDSIDSITFSGATFPIIAPLIYLHSYCTCVLCLPYSSTVCLRGVALIYKLNVNSIEHTFTPQIILEFTI